MLPANFNARAMMERAIEISRESPDLSRKVGAFFWRDGVELTTGFNVPVANAHLRRPEVLQPPLKYMWGEHAERNAIYATSRKPVPNGLQGSIAVVNWYPCVPCAEGITKMHPAAILCLEPEWDDPTWNFTETRDYLAEKKQNVWFIGQRRGKNDFHLVDKPYQL